MELEHHREAMSEISKRAKQKWMKWSTRGLYIILLRYTNEARYEEFKDRIMRRDSLSHFNGSHDHRSNQIDYP